jgi:hypothetical protein
MLLAHKREGVDLEPGVLGSDNKLSGEGPFRIVPPQKEPSQPDQSSKAANQDVVWPYNYDWDHNAGAATRSATIIRVEPLPEGTTDIDLLEVGWKYIDEEKVIIYGAIVAGCGDVNEDGLVDIDDRSQKILESFWTFQWWRQNCWISKESCGDFNGDGSVNLVDWLGINNYLLQEYRGWVQDCWKPGIEKATAPAGTVANASKGRTTRREIGAGFLP